MFPAKPPTDVPTPCHSINTISITTEVLYTPSRKENLQEILYEFENPTQVTTTH